MSHRTTNAQFSGAAVSARAGTPRTMPPTTALHQPGVPRPLKRHVRGVGQGARPHRSFYACPGTILVDRRRAPLSAVFKFFLTPPVSRAECCESCSHVTNGRARSVGFIQGREGARWAYGAWISDTEAVQSTTSARPWAQLYRPIRLPAHVVRDSAECGTSGRPSGAVSSRARIRVARATRLGPAPGDRRACKPTTRP
jgi:hypothetical protein